MSLWASQAVDARRPIQRPNPRTSRTVAPSDPDKMPVSLPQLMDNLRIDRDDRSECEILVQYLKSAVDYIETETCRVFLTAAVVEYWDQFPYGWETLELGLAPVQAVTNIDITAPGGTTTALDLADFQIDTNREPARIRPKDQGSWDTVKTGEFGAVRVTYTAGYGDDAAAVPAIAKQAIRMHASASYASRIPGCVDPEKAERAWQSAISALKWEPYP